VRPVVWAGALAAAAVLTGCTGGDGADRAAATASPSAAVTTESPPPYSPPPPPPVSATPPGPPTNDERGLPDIPFGFVEVCRGATFPGAARYAGAGPHPIEFSNATTNAPDGIDDLEAPDSVLARWGTKDVAKVQLVACITMTKGAAARKCGYIGKPAVTLYWRDYRIVVREARTGRQVGPAARVRGEVVKCAELVLANPDGTLDSQFSGISARQLQRVFTSYHSGRAR
jgi:hypothetical protein